MLKRKVFIKHDDESNEQFENRINQYFEETSISYKENDSLGHFSNISSDGSTMTFLFYHISNAEVKKQIGFNKEEFFDRYNGLRFIMKKLLLCFFIIELIFLFGCSTIGTNNKKRISGIITACKNCP